MNRFQGPGPFRPPVDRPSNAYPMGPDAADVAAIRNLEGYAAYLDAFGGLRPRGLEVVPGPEAYGSYAEYLADREAFDRGDYDDDPFREVD